MAKKGKVIAIEFTYEGKSYSFKLEVEDDDFWTTLYSEENGVETNFDTHYCEEYNSIALYPIDMQTLETDHETTVHSQPIFTKKKFLKKYPESEDCLEMLTFKE